MKKIVFTICGLLVGTSAWADGTVTTNGTEVTVAATTGTFTLKDAYPASITKLTKTGAGVLEYFPTEPSSHGEIVVQAGQLRVKSSNALGRGDISLKYNENASSLMVPDNDLTIPNKVRFGTGATVAAYGTTSNPCLTLQSVGSLNEAPNRGIRIGRTGGGATQIKLNLVGENSEAIDRINVQGKTELTFDGGMVKMAREASSPFVADLDSAYDKSYRVSPNGLTVDAAAGADVALGISPTYAFNAITSVVATAEAQNYSFESDSTGWSYTHATYTQEYSGVKANGEAFDTDGATAYTTSDGTHYYHLRRASTLTGSVTLPADGLWRLIYKNGSRPAGYYSTGIATTVAIDGTEVFVDPAITFAEKHPFRRVETPVLSLAAGAHTIALTTTDNSIGGGGINLDAFVMERVEITPVSAGLSKTGAGRLTLTGITEGVPVAVSAGALAFEGAALTNTTVTVANGATLALKAGSLAADAKVDVAAGGTLVLTDAMENRVTNGSFEADGKQDFLRDTAPKDWTYTGGTGAGAGVQGNGGTVSKSGPTTDFGAHTAYLRNATQLKQTLKSLPAGDYRVSFVQSCRKDATENQFMSHKIRTALKVDGTEVVTAGPFETPNYDYVRVSAWVTLTAGNHDLSLETTGDTSREGAMVFVDDVRVEHKVGFGELVGEIRMASGSTLRLENKDKITISKLLVGGKEVRGGRSQLTAAGIAVEGDGKVTAGGSLGLVVLVR